MAENLNIDRFRNGDIIPEVRTDSEWEKAGKECKPAWCYYNNDSANRKKYGRLYNWYAVNDPRGLAPEGWHIPTKAELETLASSAGNNSNALKATGQGTGSRAGTNTTGFSALLAGYRYNNGDFISLADNTYYWSSTVYDATNAYNMCLYYNDSNIYRYSDYRSFGFSVRCLEEQYIQNNVAKVKQPGKDNQEKYKNVQKGTGSGGLAYTIKRGFQKIIEKYKL